MAPALNTWYCFGCALKSAMSWTLVLGKAEDSSANMSGELGPRKQWSKLAGYNHWWDSPGANGSGIIVVFYKLPSSLLTNQMPGLEVCKKEVKSEIFRFFGHEKPQVSHVQCRTFFAALGVPSASLKLASWRWEGFTSSITMPLKLNTW